MMKERENSERENKSGAWTRIFPWANDRSVQLNNDSLLIPDTNLQLFLGKCFNLHPRGTRGSAESLHGSQMRYKKCSADNIIVVTVFAYI